jgi:hypothetical protein
MRYRVRFLGRSLEIISELTADARTAAGAIALVAGYQWPLGANTLQIVYLDGREIYRLAKSDLR